jgi:hypothetical protein
MHFVSKPKDLSSGWWQAASIAVQLLTSLQPSAASGVAHRSKRGSGAVV